ncbi:MAG TPA: aspartyl protease family protein [Candidatus Binatia bacterium]|nr:aspartyl protease family protein [Candidatus Binatia bacterium]
MLVAAVLVGWLAPGPARAQIYRWSDDSGTINYSQGLDSVPERHRGAATPLSFSPAPVESPRPEPSPSGSGELARLPFTAGEPVWVDARVNGGGPLRLMLDTGATVTVINPRALSAVGVPSRLGQRGVIRGATGTANVLYVRVDTIEVGSARAGPFNVVSHDVELGRGDGLLGRDFLDHFRVVIDNQSGVVTLAPK